MRKSLLILLIIIGLSACDKIPENVAGVDLKQVGELGANLLENNIKAQCENAFNEFESDDGDGGGKKRKFRLKGGGDNDGGEGGGLLDMVFTVEQRQIACDCAIGQIKQNTSANELQKLSDGGTQAIKNLISTAINTCVSEVNKAVEKKQ